jgi:hypothetical protein
LNGLSVAGGVCCAGERWEPVPGWPHEASSCGRVRSVHRVDQHGCLRLGQLLPQHPDKRKGKGYLYVNLRDGQRHRRAAVAVVVLEAHRGLRPAGCEACHNHGVRTDNHLARIRWDTREANLADMRVHAAARAVTDTPAVTAGVSQTAGHRGVRGRVGLSRVPVTGDRLKGTGRSRSFFTFPSVFTPVQPVPSPVRTSPVRIRQAA